MSEHTNSLTFSVWHYYLKMLAEKHHLSLPIFPHQLKLEDISQFLSQAEQIVLGKKPEAKLQQETLYSLFENINQESKKKQFSYDFQPLTPNSIFPKKEGINTELATLWREFVAAVGNIPRSHYDNPSLWLDHFDTAMQCFTSNLASPYSDEISFYDFTKAVAAFVVALADKDSDQENPFLLIQGDFFGIQDFIFSGGSASNKGAAKILRGRSFQVSLFTELAALKVLNACQLPTTSQMMNAAGKFLIVAPNTEAIKTAIIKVQDKLNEWFIKETYGLIGLGIAIQPAKESDFKQENYASLVENLFKSLEEQKLKRLDLTDSTQSVQNVEYPHGVCEMNSFFPAQSAENKRSIISEDQIKIGELLAKKQRIIIADIHAEINHKYETQVLKLPIFGFKIIFTNSREDTKEFGYPVKLLQIHRFWDFSLPENTQSTIWNGYARRYINAYVPFDEEGKIITFEDIQKKDKGQNALMTLKGDVDNLGTIFQKGIDPANIAKMAALSRQMNQFFSLWLPAYCAENSPNMYTVFAGGDDFFLIGPWYSTQKVAHAMQQAFHHYVAENSKIHFSVGMVMSKSGIPVPRLGDLAEEALEKAKKIDEGKNAVTIFNRTVKWADWHHLCDLEQEIHRLAEEYQISTSYLYSLILLCEQAENAKKDKVKNIESTMWRSRFYYRTARYVLDKLSKEKRDKALNEIIHSLGELGINRYKINFAIPLTNYFYQKR